VGLVHEYHIKFPTKLMTMVTECNNINLLEVTIPLPATS